MSGVGVLFESLYDRIEAVTINMSINSMVAVYRCPVSGELILRDIKEFDDVPPDVIDCSSHNGEHPSLLINITEARNIEGKFQIKSEREVLR